MAPTTVNVLLTSFPGLDLPSTLCMPILQDTSIADLTSSLTERLPPTLRSRLILSTRSGQILTSDSAEPLSSLLAHHNIDQSCLMLPVRLSAPICGGKGGFGSQLRAAGGRMSSRKKRANGDTNGSSRNLDGRRLRTVNEAKALAEYLAVKPEMEKKEREERRKRWEQVVEAADRREEEIKSGKGKAKVDGAWLEEKEESESKAREAVMSAMRSGLLRDQSGLRDYDEATDDEDMVEDFESSSDSDGEEEAESSSKATTPEGEATSAQKPKASVKARKVYGWDDIEDDDDDDNDNDGTSDEEETEPARS